MTKPANRFLKSARGVCLLGFFVLLAGCAGTTEPRWAPDDEVAQAIYHHDAPPSITLITVLNNRTGAGEHAALMINGSQRLIFDPAGTWWHPQIPERNDVHYGFTPRVEAFYLDYHTRESYDSVVQVVEVSPAVAEQALQLVQSYGAVPKAQCTKAITTVLAQLPGFQDVPRTWYPREAMSYFSARGDVQTRLLKDDDADENALLLQWQHGGQGI